jgi:hypothetical protein
MLCLILAETDGLDLLFDCQCLAFLGNFQMFEKVHA